LRLGRRGDAHAETILLACRKRNHLTGQKKQGQKGAKRGDRDGVFDKSEFTGLKDWFLKA